jgi:hypothetical protein
MDELVISTIIRIEIFIRNMILDLDGDFSESQTVILRYYIALLLLLASRATHIYAYGFAQRTLFEVWNSSLVKY